MTDINKTDNIINANENDDNIKNETTNNSSKSIKEELNSEIQDNAIEELLILKQTIEEKNEAIEKIKRENEENKDLLIRIKADFENYKKRVREEQKEMIKFSNQRLITDLLPILDDFDRAIESVPEDFKNSSFFEGLNMVVKSFHNTLEKKYFLEKIEETNITFDPHLHEAISVLEDEKSQGMIIEKVLQPGYKIDSRILRAAKVIVRKGLDKSQQNKNFEQKEETKDFKENRENCEEKLEN